MKVKQTVRNGDGEHPRCALLRLACALLLLGLLTLPAAAQMEIDSSVVLSAGDTARFWIQIPATYNPATPPAILVGWHQLGGSRWELRSTSFTDEAELRGWISASHDGPNDRHWNTRSAQQHCQAMLDWIFARYPFSRDSIYMVGGSMGGAAGQVWHNNNCGRDDYLIAATAGGSQILDCQLRQEQYLASGDTNRSMRAAFGGLPAERDSAAFEYHRYSAIHFADTSQSMHFNSLNLPVWNSWGNSDFEWDAYGFPAQLWTWRRQDRRRNTPTLTFPAADPGHGFGIMPAGSICDWLSQFTANRDPDELSINADESDQYYWTDVTLARDDSTFGRYGVHKNPAARRLDMTLAANIESIRLTLLAPWLRQDSLHCRWTNLDSTIPRAVAVLEPVPEPRSVIIHDGETVVWNYADSALIFEFQNTVDLTIVFPPSNAPDRAIPAPVQLQIASVYPNPFNGQLTVEIISRRSVRTALLVHDVLGRLVRSTPLQLQPGNTRIALDAAGLAAGAYFVSLPESPSAPLRVTLLR